MALVFTQNDLDNLKAALVTGASRVKIGDREIEYKSNKDIMEAIKIVQNYLDGVSTSVDSNPNIIRPTFSRGES